MSTSSPTVESPEPGHAEITEHSVGSEKPRWETPEMEDVSEQVMAQPYIRFT
jgi:hypothetical protein